MNTSRGKFETGLKVWKAGDNEAANKPDNLHTDTMNGHHVDITV